MAKGKLEAQINIGATVMIVTDASANSESATLASDEYYYISSADTEASDLLAQLETLINDSGGIGGAGATISMSLGSDGRVTISVSGSATLAVNWNTQTAFRDMLGFSQGNLSGASSYTGDDACKAVWLPDGHYQADYGTASGWQEDDDQILVSPRGDVFELSGASRTVNNLRWPAISFARAHAEFESVANESYQSFRNNALRAQVSCLTGRYRWHPDEADDATYFTYRGGRGQQFKPAPVRQNWTGLAVIEHGPMYKVPA